MRAGLTILGWKRATRAREVFDIEKTRFMNPDCAIRLRWVAAVVPLSYAIHHVQDESR